MRVNYKHTLMLLSFCGLFFMSVESMAVSDDYFRGFRDGMKGGSLSSAKATLMEQRRIREKVVKRLRVNFNIMAVCIIIVVSVGSKIAEWLKSKLGGLFKLSLKTQRTLITMLYSLLFAAVVLYCSAKLGFWYALPVYLLLSLSIKIYALDFYPVLLHEEKTVRRLHFSKINTLMMFMLVIILTYRMLETGISGALL